ncbi:unnamed protein product [Pichia kudriavzevii]
MSELSQFVVSIPLVTRSMTLTSLVMSGLNALNIVPITTFISDFPTIWKKLELYRLLTGFLIPNPQAMQGMMEIYMMYSFSRGIEEGKFKKNLPDYLYYLGIVLPTILVGVFLSMPPLYSLSPALLSALTFTWSVHNYSEQVNFYFMPIRASLLPPVSLGFRLLVDGQTSFFLSLIGTGAAYVYNCLETHSYGPLVSIITGKQPEIDRSNSRLGTVYTSTQTWFYSTGFLEAPEWLVRVVSRLTGTDYTSPIYNRRGFAVKRRESGGSGPNNFSGRTTGKSTATFRGEGRRLGTSSN